MLSASMRRRCDALLRELVRQLVSQRRVRLSLASIRRDSELILAEVEAAEARFVLLRCPPLGPAAFTVRELEILSWIGKGLPTKAIADKLGIGATTVETHVRRMFRKHGVSSRAALVLKAATLLS